MRVKNIPRHMNVRNNSNDASSNFDFPSNGKVAYTSNKTIRMFLTDSVEAPNASKSYQSYYVSHSNASESNVAVVAGPSSCKCLEWHLENESRRLANDESENNNGNNDGSNNDYNDGNEDNNNNWEVVDLSTRDCQTHATQQEKTEDESSASDPSDKLKDTFLYKIMTDPTFMATIQKGKQSKKYACTYCNDEFPTYESLSEHMDGKTNEHNQVVCCACKKSFAQRRYLRCHRRCHVERAKYTCDICTRKYTRLDNLARHNAFHVNPDKFACSICEKTFTRKDLLNKHLKCHENKPRFRCNECGKYFKGQFALENHAKLFHPGA